MGVENFRLSILNKSSQESYVMLTMLDATTNWTRGNTPVADPRVFLNRTDRNSRLQQFRLVHFITSLRTPKGNSQTDEMVAEKPTKPVGPSGLLHLKFESTLGH
jgi:hypothetical protein